MGRVAMLALTAAALTLGVPLAARAQPAAPRTVLDYGDSLTVGTGAYLSSFLPGWSIIESGRVGRHAGEGAHALALRLLSHSMPRILVISLGTNDDPSAVAAFATVVRRIVATAGRDRCVIWSTIARPPSNGVSYQGFNRVLRHAAATYANLRVFDWQAVSRRHPWWFGGDGVHPSAEGYRSRAAALAKLIETC